MPNELIPYELTMSAAVLEKRISGMLEKITDPRKMVDFASYLKAMKVHPALKTVSEEHRHEIWWGEILAYWKAAELLDGMPKQHGGVRDGMGSQLGTPLPATYADLGLDKREVHRWRRLHDGFAWEELEKLKWAKNSKGKWEAGIPGLNTILGRIPFETILVVPTPGKYPIIYADPPWKYDFAQFGDVAIKDYHTLDPAGIIDFKIEGKLLKQDYFDKNAVLFLWATNPKLIEALQVMAGWGFEYKTNICWDKVRATSSTMGKWLMGRHELLLIGTKGKMPPPNSDRKIESVYQEEKTGHSKKPEFFFELIEGWYALPEEAKYLELFGRSKHGEKWEVLGNQVA